jgi:phosphohistidine phosphatase SixA
MVVVARHGDYNADGLTVAGIAQAERLGEQLKSQLSTSIPILCCSLAARADQMARIMQEKMGVVAPTTLEALGDETGARTCSPEELDLAIFDLMQSDAIPVLVTHLPVIRRQIDFWMKGDQTGEWSSEYSPSLGLNEGQAVLVDLDRKFIVRI